MAERQGTFTPLRDCRDEIKEKSGTDLTDDQIVYIAKSSGIAYVRVKGELFIDLQGFYDKLNLFYTNAADKYQLRSKKISQGGIRYRTACILGLDCMVTLLREPGKTIDAQKIFKLFRQRTGALAPEDAGSATVTMTQSSGYIEHKIVLSNEDIINLVEKYLNRVTKSSLTAVIEPEPVDSRDPGLGD